MGLDRERDALAMRYVAGLLKLQFDRVEHPMKADIEHLVENRFLGIEIVIDAARLDLRELGDLPQRGRGITLSAKQFCGRLENQVAGFLGFRGAGLLDQLLLAGIQGFRL